MKNILFVLPTIPYPPRANGLSVRYYPIIQYLGAKYNVDLINITDQEDDNEHIHQVSSLVREYKIIKKKSIQVNLLHRIWLRLVSLLPFSTPLAFIFYEKKQHIKEIIAFTDGKKYDSVIFVTEVYAEYIQDLRPFLEANKWVIDFIDSNYLHKKRYPNQSLWFKYQCWKIQYWEGRMIEKVDQSIYISDTDANATIAYQNKGKPVVIPNGILIEDFTKDKLDNINSSSIGFLGNMSYKPNISAAIKLYNEIFIPLKEKIPTLSLHIIGRLPTDEIKKLGETKDVYISGEVDNIWRYVNAVSLFVLPLDMGAGQQNKILEVMYAGKPVIFSSLANGGIKATNEENCMICDIDKAEEWINATETLLTDSAKSEKIAKAGEAFIKKNYDWVNINRRFEHIILS